MVQIMAYRLFGAILPNKVSILAFRANLFRSQCTVDCRYNAVKYNKIIAYIIAGTEAEYQSEAESTKDSPYLTVTGELWDIFCEYFW